MTDHNRTVRPDDVAAPMGPYVHAIAVSPGAEWLVVSGQTGVDESGDVVEGGIRTQTRAVFRNIEGVLHAQGYGWGDVVKLTTYLTDREVVGDFRSTRDELFGGFFPDGAFPASTLAIVQGLASPEFLVEIETLAARRPPTTEASGSGQ